MFWENLTVQSAHLVNKHPSITLDVYLKGYTNQSKAHFSNSDNLGHIPTREFEFKILYKIGKTGSKRVYMGNLCIAKVRANSAYRW